MVRLRPQLAASARRPEGARRFPAREGFALPLALVALALLTGLALHLTRLGTGLRSMNRRALSSETLRAAARVGVLRGIRRLADDDNTAVDSDRDDWAREERLEHPDGTRVTIRIRDEERKVDLNAIMATRGLSPHVLETVLAQIFRAAAMEQPDLLAARLRIAAIEGDSPPEKSNRAGARAVRAYFGWPDLRESLTLVEPWPVCTNVPNATPFDIMTLLPGEREQPSRVNLNTASEPVLLALFGESRAREVAGFLELRRTGPLASTILLAGLLPPAQYRRIQDLVTVHGSVFHILALAEQDTHQEACSAWVRREADGTCRILRWGLTP